jgi:hypothetical protein
MLKLYCIIFVFETSHDERTKREAATKKNSFHFNPKPLDVAII